MFGPPAARASLLFDAVPTTVQASSSISSSYGPQYLFDGSITSANLGTANGLGNQYGSNGDNSNDYDPVVSTDYSSAVSANSFVYAQRTGGGGAAADKVDYIELWFAASSFTPSLGTGNPAVNTTPAGPPDEIVNITDRTNSSLNEYTFPDGKTFSSAHVIMKFVGDLSKNPGSNPGGYEFRLTNDSSVVQAPATFQNGGFEQPVLSQAEMVLNNPGLLPFVSLPGWTSTTTSASQTYQNIAITSAFDHVGDGNQAVLFNGDGQAITTLFQTFNTVAGVEYVVGFNLSAQTLGINGSQSTVSDAHVSLVATGNSSQTYADPTVAGSNGVFPFIGERYTFVATSSSTTLTFTQSDGTDISPILDGVTLNAVPEPGSICLLSIVVTFAGLKRQFPLNVAVHARRCA